MIKNKNNYQCSECGWQTIKWVGRCATCNSWGTVVENSTNVRTTTNKTVPLPAQPIDEVNAATAKPWETNIAEINRTLGGGLTPGSVILFTGEPGIGKSTLLLDLAAHNTLSSMDARKTLYITAEESVEQVKLRAERISALAKHLFIAAETDLGKILGHIEQIKPELLILDSVQTVGSSDIEGTIGGVNQVKEVASVLIHIAKKYGIATILVGHVTKDGSIAGPRTLEHLVDVVCQFEGDRASRLRLLRCVKNRYGPTDEIGCFDLTEDGLVELVDPSKLFLSHTTTDIPGTCVAVTLEGRRPLLVEVQSLVSTATTAQPRRATQGVDNARVSMLLAVLQSRVKLPIHKLDTYISTVGGVKLGEPAVDLAIALSLASATVDKNLGNIVACGEVGLTGEVRPVSGLSRRLLEAQRLGFSRAVIPRDSEDVDRPVSGMKILEVATLGEALQIFR